jgi:hypothetical protein
MTTTTIHPLAADYLHRLRRAARSIPRSRRDELLAEIEAHLADAIDPETSDADALSVLDRLGKPEEIVEAEQPRTSERVDPRGTKEWAAIFLLLFGGFIGGIGWLAGLVLLCSSRAWTLRDKWIGALIVPGGLIPAFVYLGTAGIESSETADSGTSTAGDILAIALTAFLVLAPIMTAIYLARRAGRSPVAGL